MKIDKKTKLCVFVFLALFLLEGCNGRITKQENEKGGIADTLVVESDLAIMPNREDSAVQSVLEPEAVAQKKLEQGTVKKEKANGQENIDVNRIYEQSEVVSAFPPFDNSQLLDFMAEHFKYPDIEPMAGRGLVDLIIEKDGTVSDVEIIKGIHPALDKEFVRVFKLFPKFVPGKVDGIPVRSKFRTPINSSAM